MQAFEKSAKLLILKYMHDLSDEVLCARWVALADR